MRAQENSYWFYLDFNHPVIELNYVININVSTTMNVWSMVCGTVICLVLEVNANIWSDPEGGGIVFL
jgi:hypothetical protein